MVFFAISEGLLVYGMWECYQYYKSKKLDVSQEDLLIESAIQTEKAAQVAIPPVASSVVKSDLEKLEPLESSAISETSVKGTNVEAEMKLPLKPSPDVKLPDTKEIEEQSQMRTTVELKDTPTSIILY